MKLKLNIVRFVNQDVITSSCAHSTSDHARILDGDESSLNLMVYEYSKNFEIPPTGCGFTVKPTSDFVNPDYDYHHDTSNIWYYYDGSKWRLCTGDHSYIDEHPEDHNTNYVVGPT